MHTTQSWLASVCCLIDAISSLVVFSALTAVIPIRTYKNGAKYPNDEDEHPESLSFADGDRSRFLLVVGGFFVKVAAFAALYAATHQFSRARVFPAAYYNNNVHPGPRRDYTPSCLLLEAVAYVVVVTLPFMAGEIFWYYRLVEDKPTPSDNAHYRKSSMYLLRYMRILAVKDFICALLPVPFIIQLLGETIQQYEYETMINNQIHSHTNTTQS